MDDASPPAHTESNAYQEQNQDMFDELRPLLLEPKREQLQQLEGRLERWRLDPDGLSRMLPKAFVQRPKPDPALGMALFPTIAEGLKQSVKKNPLVLVEAIAPVMMPAIRKAIAQALQSMMQSLHQTLEHSSLDTGMAMAVCCIEKIASAAWHNKLSSGNDVATMCNSESKEGQRRY